MTPQHPAAPETETDANGLRGLLAAATPRPWKVRNGAIYGATENGRHSLVSTDLRGANATLVLAAVNALHGLLAERDALADGCTHLENEFARLLADLDAARERVRVVEGERDAARVDAEELAHYADVAERRYDEAKAATARAESAEAAHEAEKAALIALADGWDACDEHGNPLREGSLSEAADELRSLLGGGEAR